MKRNAAHGRSFLHTAGLSRKSKFQLLGDLYRIVEKHLVEITYTVKQEAVLILLLGLEIVLHHR